MSGVTGGASDKRVRTPGDRRVLQLALATLWLLDGVLQLQSPMFNSGEGGFSGMLRDAATGNPQMVAHSIVWGSTFVARHAQATNATFASIEVLVGLGIAWRPTVKVALGASIVWSLAVWWFGEGLGGVLRGSATPVGGGPGAVLFYALLAVVLWPPAREGPGRTSVAERALGRRAAHGVWVSVWLLLAFLSMLGSGRSPDRLSNLIRSLEPGEPGWLAALDRHVASGVAGHGTVVAVVLCVACCAIAAGGASHASAQRLASLGAIAVAIVIWVLGQNFGRILETGSTDPNSGPLLVLFALAYWQPGRAVHRARHRATTVHARAVAAGVP